MKKIVFVIGCLVLGLFLAPVAMAAVVVTAPPGGGIVGSAHDLAAGYPPAGPAVTDTLGRICIYCHTPHHAYKAFGVAIGSGEMAPTAAYDYLPLWNHPFSTTLAFDTYSNGGGGPLPPSPQASQAMLSGMVIGQSSLLCLSCHDGTQAVNTYGTVDAKVQSIGAGYVVGANIIGKDGYLGNHHPIGFSYAAVQSADTGIRDAATTLLVVLGAGETIAEHLYGGDGRMECGTCHSVHNIGNSGETLLWRSDTRSRLCLTCHAKAPLPDPIP